MVTASLVIVNITITIAKEVVTGITIIVISLDSLQPDLHQHRVARANYQISLVVFKAIEAQKALALQVVKLVQRAMQHQNHNQDRARFFSTLLDAFQWLLQILEHRDRISSCDFLVMPWSQTPYHSRCMY